MYESCADVKEMLVAFLDDELACDVSHHIQEHLDRCPPCARLARAEEGFTRALKGRLCRIEAPPVFVDSIRRRLKDPESLADSPATAPRRRHFFPVAARAAAALVVLAALAVLSAEFIAPGSLRGMIYPLTGVRHAAGVLVCVECERMGVPIEHQRQCHKEGHHTGFKCPQTGLWNLVANDASRPLLADPAKRGEQVTVVGRFLKDIRYLDARSITPAAGT